MSFLQGLRASSSRSMLPGVASRVSNGQRYISTLQEAEREIARIKAENDKRQRRAEMMTQSAGRQHIDVSKVDVPLLEQITEAPFKFSYIYGHWLDPGAKIMDRWEYIKQATQRVFLTYQSISAMTDKGDVLQATKADKKNWSLLKAIMGWIRPTIAMEPTMRQAMDMYIKYNEALASGNIAALKETSCNKLLDQGEKIARSSKKMRWQLAQDPKLPVLKWARMAPLEDSRFLGEVCLRFDTKQSLTTYDSRGKPTVRTQDVTDHIVFKFLSPSESIAKSWRMMERVPAFPPGFTLQGPARAEYQARVEKQEQMQSGGLQVSKKNK